MCLPVVAFPDENSESESDSDDRFKGKADTLPQPRGISPSFCMPGPRVQTGPGAWGKVNRKVSLQTLPSEQEVVEKFFSELSPSMLNPNVGLSLSNLKQLTLSILPKPLSMESGYYICLVSIVNLECQA